MSRPRPLPVASRPPPRRVPIALRIAPPFTSRPLPVVFPSPPVSSSPRPRRPPRRVPSPPVPFSSHPVPFPSYSRRFPSPPHRVPVALRIASPSPLVLSLSPPVLSLPRPLSPSSLRPRLLLSPSRRLPAAPRAETRCPT
ncbi:unnamed protein product [Closterium sp. NIES-54]